MSLNISWFATNKKNLADIKRVFRNSLDEELYSLGVHSHDIKTESIFVDYHLHTEDLIDKQNDDIEITTSLHDNRICLSIRQRNNYFDKWNMVKVFMDESTRKQLVKSLEDMIINND